jgi:hypothetical protein
MTIDDMVKNVLSINDKTDKNTDSAPGTGAGAGFTATGAAKTAQKYGFALKGGSMQSSVLTGGHNNTEKSDLDDGIADVPNWVDTQLSRNKNPLSPIESLSGSVGHGMWALAALKRRWGR